MQGFREREMGAPLKFVYLKGCKLGLFECFIIKKQSVILTFHIRLGESNALNFIGNKNNKINMEPKLQYTFMYILKNISKSIDNWRRFCVILQKEFGRIYSGKMSESLVLTPFIAG